MMAKLSCSNSILLLFACCTILNVTLVLSKDCLLVNQCKCSFDDGSGSVDLTSLGYMNNTPRFQDVFGDDSSYYSYNPCGGFNEGSCSNAAACAISEDKSEQLQIGDASTAKTQFNYDEGSGNVVVSYTAGAAVIRLTHVALVCDHYACDPKFEPQGEVSTGQFLMQLTTICACPGECTASGSPKCKFGNGSGSSGGLGGAKSQFTKHNESG